MTTAAERKAMQRSRDRLLGWREITVRVAQEHAERVRDFAASLPDPAPPTDPDQLDLLERLEEDLNSDKSPQPDLF